MTYVKMLFCQLFKPFVWSLYGFFSFHELKPHICNLFFRVTKQHLLKILMTSKAVYN